MTDPLADLTENGVSIWLVDLSRQRLASGSLADLAANDHVLGGDHQPGHPSPRPSPAATRTRIKCVTCRRAAWTPGRRCAR